MIKTCTNCKKIYRAKSHDNHRLYCDKCRIIKYAAMHARAQLRLKIKKASIPDENKIRCPLCTGYYTQLASHIIQRHRDQFKTAREIKEKYGLDRKKGIVPKEYSKKKALIEAQYKDIRMENFSKGKQTRFKPGQVPNYKRSKETLARLKRKPISKQQLLDENNSNLL